MIGPAEQTSLTIAIQLAAVNNSAPYYIAQSKGYFQDEGLTVKQIVAQDPRSAITGGSADIGTAIAGNVIQAASQNLPLKLIGSHACRQPYSFAVAPGITSAQGLSGKDILIAATAGDPQTTSRKQVLKEAGWDLSAVNPPPNYVNVPGGSNAWAKLFTAGKLFLMPSFDQVRGSLAAYGATFLGDKLEPWPSDYYFAGTSWLASHQNTTAHFLRAVIKAMTFMADPANTAAVLALMTAQGYDTSSVTTTSKYPLSQETLCPNLYLSESQVSTLEQIQGLPSVPFTTLADLGPLMTAQQSLGLDNTYPTPPAYP